MIGIHFVHRAVEPQERTVDDSNIVALDKPDLLARPGRSGIHLLQEGIGFFRRQRLGCAPPPTNPVTFGRLLDHLQGFIGQRRFQLHQNIAREKLSPGGPPFAVLDFDHIFRRHQHLPEPFDRAPFDLRAPECWTSPALQIRHRYESHTSSFAHHPSQLNTASIVRLRHSRTIIK